MSICASGQRAFSDRTSGVVSSTSPRRRVQDTRMVRGGLESVNGAVTVKA
ncbi:lipopolysaccharide core biosynthesis heptosyltransferase domain protein [Burkholderia pseudomallei MSHR5613]|nr:lipopolysaccharide core biosynthesis heptosyltransferase domain protein [Burkholderia pseudomallei MSHR5613]